MSKKGENGVAPLMKKWGAMGSHDLTDELYAIAYNIEQTMLNAGAVPGKDYSYLDLIKLAQPFVLDMFKSEGRISYSYPADEVSGP